MAVHWQCRTANYIHDTTIYTHVSHTPAPCAAETGGAGDLLGTREENESEVRGADCDGTPKHKAKSAYRRLDGTRS